MLKVKSRSILKDNCLLNAPETTRIVSINTVGAMGRGIALDCKKRYPDVYRKYKKGCELGIVQPNSLLTCSVGIGEQILLFPTKIDWRKPSPPQLIIDNLYKLADIYTELNIDSLAVPSLGMGNGGLRGDDKQLVWDTMLEVFNSMDIPCTIYT